MMPSVVVRTAKWQEALAMADLEKITALLGGPTVFGVAPRSTIEMVEAVRTGFPYPTFTVISQRLELSQEKTAELLRLPLRTMQRRQDDRLDAEQSERVLRLARLILRATEVFGDTRKAMHWLFKPNRSLNAVTPVSLVDTDIGMQEAEDVLGRIEHGIPG
jgi:putative toxin-antitoxin system antitoxin component (TIGR02293 family)